MTAPPAFRYQFSNLLILAPGCFCWIYQWVQYKLAAPRTKKSYLFGHLFFNITNVFCAKKRVGHAACLYICPKDGHWPAIFEVVPPPQKVDFSVAKKMKIPQHEHEH